MEITVQFVGGPLDGTITFQEPVTGGPPPSGDALFAWMFYTTTGGKVGKCSMGLSPAGLKTLMTGGAEAAKSSGMKAHQYCVMERKDGEGKVFVRAEAFEEPSMPDALMKLEEYTNDQLVSELVNRATFKGFIMYKNVVPGAELKDGDQLPMRYNLDLKLVAKMMRSVLPQIDPPASGR